MPTPFPWSTFWAAVNALAAVVAALGAWLAFKTALKAHRASLRPVLSLIREHGRTHVRNVGNGPAMDVVAVGEVGGAEKLYHVASAIRAGDNADISNGSDPFSYTPGFSNVIFYRDVEGQEFCLRATSNSSMGVQDNVRFAEENFEIPAADVPKDVRTTRSSQSALDWLRRVSKTDAK